jgi:hypothetical protein
MTTKEVVCLCDVGEKYRCLDCEWFLMDRARDYTKKLGLTCNDETLLEMIGEVEVGLDVVDVDIRPYVWDYLDAYEGISHSRDPDYWKDEEDEKETH